MRLPCERERLRHNWTFEKDRIYGRDGKKRATEGTQLSLRRDHHAFSKGEAAEPEEFTKKRQNGYQKDRRGKVYSKNKARMAAISER